MNKRTSHLARWGYRSRLTKTAVIPLFILMTSALRAQSEVPVIDQLVHFCDEQPGKTVEERGEKEATLWGLLYWTYAGKVKWDGCWNIPTDKDGKKSQGGVIAVTTADCPSDTYPNPPDKYKKGWGEKQIIAFHKCWKKLLQDSHGATGYSCLVLLMSTFVHELVHTDQEFCYQFPTPQDEAKQEKPAYCKQVDFLCKQLDSPPLSTNPTGPDADVVRRFKEEKKKQKEEWCKKL